MVTEKKDLPELPNGYEWMWVHSSGHWAAFNPKSGHFIHPGEGEIATIVDDVNKD